MLAPVLLGSTLSLALYQAWQLDNRWAAVVFIAITAIALAMCFARFFSDFLLVTILFCLPVATFIKWFFPGGFDEQEYPALAAHGVLGIGLIDFLLAGLYLSWFYRIFISREAELPRLHLLDALVLWYVCANLVAAIGSHSMAAGIGSTEYLAKNALFYFYMSRHLNERQLPWLLAAFVFIIAIETPLSSYQFATGRLTGLALNKGAGGSGLNWEYQVPGIENYSRATGFSYDSHVLGEFVGALLPFPLVLSFMPRLRTPVRLACLAASGGALLVVFLSLSRTGWVATAATLLFGIVLIVFVWRERQVVPVLAGLTSLAALLTPFVANFVYQRFAQSPVSTVTARFEMFDVAFGVIKSFPLFGVGPANYTHALRLYDTYGFLDFDQSGRLVHALLPVHNSFLSVAAELGIFGLLAYVSVLTVAAWRLFSMTRARRDLPARLALGALLGLMTIVLNDQFNAGFREPDVFLLFWLLVALSAALPRLPLGAGALLVAPSQPPGRTVTVPALPVDGSP